MVAQNVPVPLYYILRTQARDLKTRFKARVDTLWLHGPFGLLLRAEVYGVYPTVLSAARRPSSSPSGVLPTMSLQAAWSVAVGSKFPKISSIGSVIYSQECMAWAQMIPKSFTTYTWPQSYLTPCNYMEPLGFNLGQGVTRSSPRLSFRDL